MTDHQRCKSLMGRKDMLLKMCCRSTDCKSRMGIKGMKNCCSMDCMTQLNMGCMRTGRWKDCMCLMGRKGMLLKMCFRWMGCTCLLHRKGMLPLMCKDCTCLLHRGCTMADR